MAVRLVCRASDRGTSHAAKRGQGGGLFRPVSFETMALVRGTEKNKPPLWEDVRSFWQSRYAASRAQSAGPAVIEALVEAESRPLIELLGPTSIRRIDGGGEARFYWVVEGVKNSPLVAAIMGVKSAAGEDTLVNITPNQAEMIATAAGAILPREYSPEDRKMLYSSPKELKHILIKARQGNAIYLLDSFEQAIWKYPVEGDEGTGPDCRLVLLKLKERIRTYQRQGVRNIELEREEAFAEQWNKANGFSR